MIAIILSEEFLSTPSARRATGLDDAGTLYAGISIHALREEGDKIRPVLLRVHRLFLSTPSARRATNDAAVFRQHGEFLSTPSARRATCFPGPLCCCHTNFYPRPPRGGRRAALCDVIMAPQISIHALREEGDSASFTRARPSFYFYPRPPRGGRRNTSYQRAMADIFLSTPSARRATTPYTPL